MKNIIILILCLASSMVIIAQNNLHVSGGYLIQSGNNIIIKDGKLTNDGTFLATAGNVTMTGTESTANSSVEGTGNTEFFDLTIDKSSNNASLGQDITVKNDLTFLDGSIDIETSDLTISQGGEIVGFSSDNFVITPSTGTLKQTVSTPFAYFPVGKTEYSLAILSNPGTTDQFSVRATDVVYLEGTTGSEITMDNVDVTWFIDEATPSGSNATLILFWPAASELSGFDRNNCFVTHFTNGAWTIDTPGTATGTNPYSKTLSGITDFSPFSVSSNSAVLPVELLSFDAIKDGINVRLDWETATEINNDLFEVEWSKDGEDFVKIGLVNGAGTTVEKQEYQFFHREPILSMNYYRLRQVDFDGSYEYSNIEAVQFSKDELITLALSPNPTTNYVFIQTNHVGLFQIYDELGRIVRQGIINGNQSVDLSDIPAGIYFVKVGTATENLIIR